MAGDANTTALSGLLDMGEPSPPPIYFAQFLANHPPTAEHIPVLRALVRDERYGHEGLAIARPSIELACSFCEGLRVFQCVSDKVRFWGSSDIVKDLVFLRYLCRNCQRTEKQYAISFRKAEGLVEAMEGAAFCHKFGEHPVFGEQTPTRLLRIFGEDREIFLSGRRSENQGLGLGAFTYYRRVIENQRGRIFDEIIKVCKRTGGAEDLVAKLEAAKAEQQFAKSLADARDAIPQALKVGGHNPLLLLHSALSEGIHGRSDEECLGLAQAVRVVMSELADRIGQILKDEAELNDAVSRLMNVRTKKPTT